MKASKEPCPLCGSLLPLSKFNKIIGRWEGQIRLEKKLKEQLQKVRMERTEFLIKTKQLKKENKQAVKEAKEEGRKKEKARAERLSKMIQRNLQTIEDKDKTIKELKEQLQKGTTPQIEGFNLELELKKELEKEFSEDTIERHGKVGDILQRVYFKNKQVGSILYECKNTSKFENKFISQVKKAMLKRQTTYGVLVTFAFKKGTHGFWVEKDILVVHPYGAVYIAQILRKSIIDSLRVSPSEMEKQAKELMNYINGDDFKNSVEDCIYRTRSLYDILQKERRVHQSLWLDRVKHYSAIHMNISGLELATSNILKGLPPKESFNILKQKRLPPLLPQLPERKEITM